MSSFSFVLEQQMKILVKSKLSRTINYIIADISINIFFEVTLHCNYLLLFKRLKSYVPGKDTRVEVRLTANAKADNTDLGV